jgi:hypothetical protein
MQTWTRLIIDYGTISKSSGRLEWLDKHTNYNGEASLDFQLDLNTLGVLSVPTDTL